MSRFFYLLLVTIAINQSVSAQVTIHVLNPWRTDTCAWHRDSLRMVGNNYVGYYPGSSMAPEGADWFFYSYSDLTVPFKLTDWCGPNSYDGLVTYRYTLHLDSILMKLPSGTKNIWIVISDTTKLPTITSTPPTGSNFKVIYFLNPWDIGGALIQYSGLSSMPKMAMDTSSARCGWFIGYCAIDTPKVKFLNSLDSSVFSSNGSEAGDFINLAPILKTSDTVWVYPTSYPTGPAATSNRFPNVSAQCQKTILLAADMHDIGDHPDFDRYNALSNISCAGLQTGQVQKKLGANGLPAKSNTTVCPQVITQFDWFDTKTLSGAYTNEICYNLRLQKNEDGYYYYDDSLFYPIDDFLYLDSAKTVPNPNNNMLSTDPSAWKEHNNHFTMIVSADFEYKKGQTFYFRGDDDVWVFVDSQLVVDLGGVHPPAEGSVNLDTLHLTLNKTYNFKLFYTERNCCGSNFRMLTSLNLRTNSNLFAKETILAGGVKIDSMFQKITQNSLTCVASQTVIGTQPAVVVFYIEGPGFTQPEQLTVQTQPWYGGITISNTRVLIDTASISGLNPGNYVIRYYLQSDNSQTGTITFTVYAPPAHHYDLLTDTMTLDPKKDAVIDSIVIGMLDSTAQVYAVIRDSAGLYLRRAVNPSWNSSNTLAATVAQSATDSSRCIITKTGSGTTWVYVSDPTGKLKPDSVKVITLVLPEYPVISSAIMLDTNSDITPDKISITLNDTFKTNQNLDSITISYRGNIYSIPSSQITINGTAVTASFTSITGKDGRPSGTVSIFMTIKNSSESSQKTFTDGVDPDVIAADVLENDGTGADTLFITFSEPVLSSSLSGRQLLLIKANTADTLALDIAQVIKKTNDSTYTLQVMSSGLQPKAGDRLRLLPGINGGVIYDQSKNAPHILNPSVVLGLRVGPTAIISACYRDGNADGYIDTVTLYFKRPVTVSAFKSVTALWDVTTSMVYDTIILSEMAKINDSSYKAPIHGNKAIPGKVCTNASITVMAEYNDFPDLPARTAIAADSAAPVIDSAKLAYGNSLATDSTSYNILTVKFSEIIPQISSAHPFLLKALKNGAIYQFRLTTISTVGKTCTFRADTIDVGNIFYALKGDSIWIDPAASVKDNYANAQINSLNRRVPLDATTQPAQWTFSIVPNPFTPVTGSGSKITVKSKTVLVDADRYSLRMVIFDIIGNTVISSDMTSEGNGWSYTWDGRNRSGRMVGNGVYPASIKIFKDNKETYSKRVKIGIKR